MQYNFLKGFKKSLISLLVFFIPFAIDFLSQAYPYILQLRIEDIFIGFINKYLPILETLTIGGILSIILNYLKVQKTIMGKRKIEALKRIENGD